MSRKKNLLDNYFPWQRGEKPLGTNDKGVQWYLDSDMQRHASNVGAKKVVCVFIRTPELSVTRGIIDTSRNELVFDSPRLEDVAVHLEMMGLAQKGETNDQSQG